MKTRIVQIDSIDSGIEDIRRAAEIVENGGLVAFPTETVYGIACLASPASLDKLDLAKGRTPDKRYTLHISSPDDLSQYVPSIGARAKKLIAKAWPGPLTVVFALDADSVSAMRAKLGMDTFDALYTDMTIGVRCPDNPIASKLLEIISGPVVAPSANLTGSPPAVDAQQVLAQLDGKIDMILDGRQWAGCRYDQSSTVVGVSGNKVEIIRQGVIKSDQIERMSSIQICFVCTGNTCRSPMAEAFCKKILAEKNNCDIDELDEFGYKIVSAATMDMWQTPASPEVIEICAGKGIDMTGHRSRTLELQDVKDCDLIFVMTQTHLDHLFRIWPDAESKCALLDPKGDIADPIGAGKRIYNACALQIEKAVERRMCEIMI
jgi:protein-tyrosine phosphatase